MMLTIITPTFNRASCLKKCWCSLEKQTNHEFQWLVVDDGSTDETKQLIQGIRANTKDITIDYLYKENGGKHTALNASHPLILGDFVLVLDSDDTLIPEAVDLIKKAVADYGNNPEVGQLIFLKGYSEEEPICTVVNEKKVVDTLKEKRIARTGRDCCDVFRKELFVKHRFPEYEGERFIGEGAAFLGIELESQGVYFNRVIYLCEYREDGLTKAGRAMRIRNPRGGMYNSYVYMNKRLPLKTRIKKGILFSCYSHFANVTFAECLKKNEYIGMTLVTYIPGTLLYLYWKKKYY